MNARVAHREVQSNGRREPWLRPRSLFTLLPVAIIPPTLGATAVGAALGGLSGATFGAIFGVVLGLLAVGFALFLGWFTHRST